MAKSMYEGLFQWIVEELNRKLNFRSEGASSRQIKLLDIYGF